MSKFTLMVHYGNKTRGSCKIWSKCRSKHICKLIENSESLFSWLNRKPSCVEISGMAQQVQFGVLCFVFFTQIDSQTCTRLGGKVPHGLQANWQKEAWQREWPVTKRFIISKQILVTWTNFVESHALSLIMACPAPTFKPRPLL